MASRLSLCIWVFFGLHFLLHRLEDGGDGCSQVFVELREGCARSLIAAFLQLVARLALGWYSWAIEAIPLAALSVFFGCVSPQVDTLMGLVGYPFIAFRDKVPDFGGTGIHPLAQELWWQNSHPLPLFHVYSRRVVNAVCVSSAAC